MRRLIGLTGFASAGKDAVGSVLCEHHGFTRVAFADALKALAIDEGWSGRKDEEGRRFLQELGMRMRLKRPSYWIVAALNTMDHLPGDIVITDARFLNEIYMIRDRGGEVWRIIRPGVVAANDHISEHEWHQDVPDRLIRNDGTLADLSRRIDQIIAVPLSRAA